MSKKHGLAGLFSGSGDDGEDNKAPDLPPVLDDADASPMERLAKKLELKEAFEDDFPMDHDPFGSPIDTSGPQAPFAAEDDVQSRLFGAPALPDEPAEIAPPDAATPAAPQPAAAPEPAPTPARAYTETTAPQPRRPVRSPLKPTRAAPDKGVLCFILEGGDERMRRRTLEALNEAAGHYGAINLRALPTEPEAMNAALSAALEETDCLYAAFLSPGTEPAGDWSLEVQMAFEEAPNSAGLAVRAANSDPLSPWARVSFFIDEAERQRGSTRGFDTMVFRVAALRDLGDDLGFMLRNGELIHALQKQGLKIGKAPEARVQLATPTGRKEVMARVREQARLLARLKAKRMNPAMRMISSLLILLSYPVRIMSVRTAAKRAVGTTQFREVASKAAMAVFADRRVRAMTMLNPGKPNT